MALILSQRELAAGVYDLRLGGVPAGRAGQFLMLHIEDGALLLPRPISIADAEEDAVRLVYRVAGRGTKRLSLMRAGETLRTEGPHGNGFPLTNQTAVLIGGGLGVAPMLYLARSLKRVGARVEAYMGFSGTPFLTREFREICDLYREDVGGYVTELVDFSAPAVYYACGPEPMLRAAAGEAKHSLYVSLERRMACGVGACYACSVMTKSGSRRVCKDGPVFLSDEVFYEQA